MGYVINDAAGSTYGLSDGEWAQVLHLCERRNYSFVSESLALEGGEEVALTIGQGQLVAAALRSALALGEILDDVALFDLDRLDRGSAWGLLEVLEGGGLRVRRTVRLPSPVRRFAEVG